MTDPRISHIRKHAQTGTTKSALNIIADILEELLANSHAHKQIDDDGYTVTRKDD